MSFYKSVIWILILFSALVISCRKYEYGPTITLLTKQQRISKKWMVEETFTPNDFSITYEYTGTFHFKDNGEFEEKNTNYNVSGNWNFSENQEDIIITSPNLIVFKILRLKNDELWFIDEVANREYHLIPVE